MGVKVDFEHAVLRKKPDMHRGVVGKFSECFRGQIRVLRAKLAQGKIELFLETFPLFDLRKLGRMWIWACMGGGTGDRVLYSTRVRRPL